MTSYMQKYYQEHKEELKKLSHENYLKNKDRKLALHKIWLANNKEKIKKWRHEYYLKNKEKYSEWNRKYYLEHKSMEELR